MINIDTWNQEKKQFLTENYPKFGAEFCATALGYKLSTIHIYARQLGIKRYQEKEGFKTCSCCHKEKRVSEFYPYNRGRLGVTAHCKRCMRNYSENFYQQNPDRAQAKLETTKKWLKTKRKHFNNYLNNQYHNNMNYRLSKLLRGRLKIALKNCAKTGSAIKDLGCSILELMKHLESKFQPGMTWKNCGEWEIDHIKPLSSFDLSKHNQLLEACHYTNLQPLWASDNRKKGAKLI